jgi:hypothetical protein
LIHRFLSRAAQGYVLRLEPNLLIKNYDMFNVFSGWGNSSTNHLCAGAVCGDKIIFFKSIALSVVARVLACSSDKRSMKKSGQRW